ncbi:ABC transporter ATP-binding protein [Lactobacillus intestinalis]|uniref:ABC transporter ATP-binding protein n=1 Tax=Lactobacillus intestinalis TaxID=151781 RepID=UPI00070DBCFD|nr:ABC transporter ATP-binding protein [Lactobacillus intestinalis]UTW40683.1 ABC transporter ATP-binding protein [Lactobacillus intestinalis]
MIAIKVENLTKKYGERIILNKINFTINEGEFVAIVGPSGAGKSTVLNILGMLEKPTSGEVYLSNQKLPSINSRKATILRRNKINYLFQSYALISDLTVLQNLQIAVKFNKESSRIINQKIDKVLEDLDIVPLKNSRVNTLSGGEQQRVALARCILKPGNLVLADEPTGALDPSRAEEAFDQIKLLRDHYHKTIIMVTHNMEEAEKTDRILDLNRL